MREKISIHCLNWYTLILIYWHMQHSLSSLYLFFIYFGFLWLLHWLWLYSVLYFLLYFVNLHLLIANNFSLLLFNYKLLLFNCQLLFWVQLRFMLLYFMLWNFLFFFLSLGLCLWRDILLLFKFFIMVLDLFARLLFSNLVYKSKYDILLFLYNWFRPHSHNIESYNLRSLQCFINLIHLMK